MHLDLIFHPPDNAVIAERSAARIYRITDGLCAESKDLGGAYLNYAIQAFSPQVCTDLGMEDPVLGHRGQKAPSSIDKIRPAGVLRLRATKRCVPR